MGGWGDPDSGAGRADPQTGSCSRSPTTRPAAILGTLDFFPPLVDDPATYGAIAAANALSDVFAMGGRVLFALSIAALPEDFPKPALAAVLEAAAAKVREAGGVLAGGHTIRDPEPKYGLAVVGAAHPDGRFTAPALEVADGVAPELVALAHDPQTSGGLLASVPPGRVAAVEADLEAAGVAARRVGTVESGDPGVALR